jgi:hypothetical protein
MLQDLLLAVEEVAGPAMDEGTRCKARAGFQYLLVRMKHAVNCKLSVFIIKILAVLLFFHFSAVFHNLSKIRIHERTISLRFLGIILRVLGLRFLYGFLKP